MKLLELCWVLVLLLHYVSIKEVTPAAAHVHSHSRDINNEREEDGSYAPRDSHHTINEDHNVEFDHEAILGSMKEAEQFDNLSPKEAKKRLAILAKKMDLNKDGVIEQHELKAWILRSFSSLNEEEASERFTDIDQNTDGRVTWKEYLIDSYGTGEDDEVIMAQNPDEEQMINDDRVMFDTADSNKDGYLDENEFVVFNHPEEYPQMLPIILNQTLRDKDSNKDNYIDFQEYIGQRGLHQDKEWLIVEKDKFDNDFDKDKDGRLNSEEILSWVVPSQDEIAEDEVNHLFAAADDDHDNILSLEEILEHHDTFVGSEATDYGDQLQNLTHDEL